MSDGFGQPEWTAQDIGKVVEKVQAAAWKAGHDSARAELYVKAFASPLSFWTRNEVLALFEKSSDD